MEQVGRVAASAWNVWAKYIALDLRLINAWRAENPGFQVVGLPFWWHCQWGVWLWQSCSYGFLLFDSIPKIPEWIRIELTVLASWWLCQFDAGIGWHEYMHMWGGSLVASSVDQNGELRLPSEGSQELFWLAGMSGTHVIPCWLCTKDKICKWNMSMCHFRVDTIHVTRRMCWSCRSYL